MSESRSKPSPVNSPFVLGRVVRGAEFVGRATELRTILSRLAQGESTAIIGEARSGKSSLLFKVAEGVTQLRSFGAHALCYKVCHIDLQTISSDYSPWDFWREALSVYGIDFASTSRAQLARIFTTLNSQKKHLVVLLDEFDSLLVRPKFDATFFAMTRSLATTSGAFSLVIASRLDMAQLNRARPPAGYGSPYLNYFVSLRLGALGVKAAETLLDRAGSSFTVEDRRYVRRVAGTHPFLVQAMAGTLFETSGNDRRIRAAEKFFELASSYFDEQWKALSQAAQTAVVIAGLASMAEDRVGKNSRSISEAYHREMADLARRGFVDIEGKRGEGSSLHEWRLIAALTWWVRELVIDQRRLPDRYDRWLKSEDYLRFLAKEAWGRLYNAARSTVTSEQFVNSVPWAPELIRSLNAEDFWLTQAAAAGPQRWLLRVAVPEMLRQTYGTAPEILLLVVHGEVESRDLKRARLELFFNELELDPDLLVIVDDWPRLAQRLDWLSQVWGQWIPWPYTEGDLRPLTEQFRRYLPAFDVFEQRDPVRGRQVIGRKDVVADISKRLLQGQALGVFGLRKMGKTTAVRAVTDKLDPISARLTLGPQSTLSPGKASMLVVWLDVQVVFERTLERVAGELVRNLEKRLAAEELAVSPASALQSMTERLGELIEFALERSELTICFVIDEYDLLFEGSSGKGGIAGIESLFRLFRGQSQVNGRLSLVVIGRDPYYFERPEMGGHTNPMLNWFVPRWLGPLTPPAAAELLQKLGRRVLLDVGPETVAAAQEWTGGHPLLHRQYGSALLQRSRDRVGLKESAGTDSFHEEALDIFLERQAVTEICQEVNHLLTNRYPDSAELLTTIGRESPDRIAEVIADHGGWHQPTVRRLRNFGLLLEDAGKLMIPGVIRWYLSAMAPRLRRMRA